MFAQRAKNCPHMSHMKGFSSGCVIMGVFMQLLTLEVLEQTTQSYCTLTSSLLRLALCRCWPIRKSFSLWDFKWQTKLLPHVYFCNMKIEVSTFVAAVRQCYKFGHISKFCTKEQQCLSCGEAINEGSCIKKM
jgi:hypothetical protein